MAKKGKYTWRRVTTLRAARARRRPARVETPEVIPESAEIPVVLGEPDEIIQSPDMEEDIEVQKKLEEPVVEVEELPSADQDIILADMDRQQAVPSSSVSPLKIGEKKSRSGARVILTLILITVSLVSGILIADLLQWTESVGASVRARDITLIFMGVISLLERTYRWASWDRLWFLVIIAFGLLIVAKILHRR